MESRIKNYVKKKRKTQTQRKRERIIYKDTKIIKYKNKKRKNRKR